MCYHSDSNNLLIRLGLYNLPQTSYRSSMLLRAILTAVLLSTLAMPMMAAAAPDQSTGVVAPDKSPIGWTRAVNTRPGREAPDLMERLRDGFGMPDLNNELVQKYQNYYIQHPGAMRRLLDNGRRYAYYVLEELERRGMPSELALLPMVESSYNPKALSPARAAGLWQFIPSTGRSYGLSQSWWEDNRRDVVSSTGAALDYLSYLYSLMGDWHLALASYNWGEGSVGRAVAKNQAQGMATGYDDLRMPAETKNYVPRLQAIKNILRDPQLVAQMNLPVLPNRPYFESVALYGKHIDLDTVAKLANISVDEVKALNPEHSRPVMKVETINLPKDRVPQFKSNLNAYQESEKPLSRWGSYTVQPGEKAERIAGKFNMSLAQLQEANGVSMKSLSKPGQPLLVLSNPAAEQTPGTASLTSLNENTPVNVVETPDKPVIKAIPAHSDSVPTKAKASTAKDDKSSKAQKSNQSEKSDKTTKTAKPEKSSAKTTTASSKPAAKAATGSKPASKPSAAQKK